GVVFAADGDSQSADAFRFVEYFDRTRGGWEVGLPRERVCACAGEDSRPCAGRGCGSLEEVRLSVEQMTSNSICWLVIGTALMVLAVAARAEEPMLVITPSGGFAFRGGDCGFGFHFAEMIGKAKGPPGSPPRLLEKVGKLAPAGEWISSRG